MYNIKYYYIFCNVMYILYETDSYNLWFYLICDITENRTIKMRLRHKAANIMLENERGELTWADEYCIALNVPLPNGQ